MVVGTNGVSCRVPIGNTAQSEIAQLELEPIFFIGPLEHEYVGGLEILVNTNVLLAIVEDVKSGEQVRQVLPKLVSLLEVRRNLVRPEEFQQTSFVGILEQDDALVSLKERSMVAEE